MKKTDRYAAGVDSGTQGTKGLVVELETGRVLGRGRAPHASIEGLGPGASEQDPAVWIGDVETALAAPAPFPANWLGITRILPGCTTAPRPTATMDAYFSDVYVNAQ